MDSYALKSVLDLPDLFRPVFNFRYFNSLQSECFPICFHSDVNMVISAPTGSGKTVLFELCILRLLSRFIGEKMKFIHAKGTLKTIYMAPSKALVQEKLRDWSRKFGSLGINCLELTGDNETYGIHNIQEADIILTTPEKFDAVSRYRMKDGGLSFFSDIALLLIDEVHLLNDPRGAALEAIVSRIKMLARNPDLKLSPLARVRLLAVSATIPNLEDLAEWLMVPPQGIKRFGEEMRPVKLTSRVLGYTSAKNDFLFEQRLQNFIFDILMQYSKGKSALVFCSTRKGAQEAAQRLTQSAMTFGYSNPFIKDKERQERLREASLSCSDKQMQSYILYGVAFHHGGVSLKDRNLVEGLFLKGDVQVLCTTNTLAHGINLPAHTVIIKSTRHFNKEKGLYMEYDRSTILQMCGRAGRPPFDDTGTVIIMTRKETVHLYEDLLNGCEVVESQLLPCVTEHLTAEIVQMTISDVTQAIDWMKCSYLYVRTKKDPTKYAVRKSITSDQIEKHMQEICVQKVNELSEHQMIWTDEDGFVLKPLEPGRLMTKYYLRFDTMKYIMQASTNCGLEDALRIVCQAEEISWIQLRRNEKKLLNDINADKNGRLRFHVVGDKGKPKKRIQTRAEKIFVLVNDFLTGDPSVHDLSMTQDMNSISSNGSRVAKCMKEYFIYKKNYVGAANSTLLAKSLHQKLWDNSQFLLKQLPGIGMVTAKALHSMGVYSFGDLNEADSRRIEIVTGRKYPFGNQIKESLQSLPPKVEMEVQEIDRQRQGKIKILVTLTRVSQSIQSHKRHYADMIVGSEEDNLIYFHEKIRVNEFNSPYSATVFLPLSQKGKLTVMADLLFEEYLGIDLHKRLPLIENSSSSSYRNGNHQQPLSFPPSRDLLSRGNNARTSTAKASDLRNSRKTNGENSYMPSFALIDEDQLEDTESATEAKDHEDDDDCKIISERTVFDHIREKAKSFPVLSPPKITRPPSSQLLSLTRKRTREKPIQPHCEILLEETTANFPPQSLTDLSPDPKETAKCGFERNSNLRNGAVGSKENEVAKPNDSRPSTEETIFDHIRKKSKNFPVLNSVKIIDSEPFPWMEDYSFDMEPNLITPKEAVSDAIPRNSYAISSLEPKRNSNAPKASPRMSRDLSSKDMLSFDISMARRSNISAAEPHTASAINEKPSRVLKSLGINGSRGMVTDKSREVDSFLGFKSVFSFL